jgi:ribosome-associated heat shock protein Hsp15
MAAGHDQLWGAGPPGTGQRLDKWLYFARLAKSRTVAADLILGGKVRINRARVGKPSQLLRIWEVVTIALHGRVLVLKVLDAGRRRGPAAEARTLYEVVSPPPGPAAAAGPGLLAARRAGRGDEDK